LDFADRRACRGGVFRLATISRHQSDGRRYRPKVGRFRARCRRSVTVAPVTKADFPVYLGGLGTVQGFNTVLVRTRVDGQIDKIAFKEGHWSTQGDLLVQIDPRPYQAALDQAKAKRPRMRPIWPTPISICSVSPSSASSQPGSRPTPALQPWRN